MIWLCLRMQISEKKYYIVESVSNTLPNAALKLTLAHLVPQM